MNKRKYKPGCYIISLDDLMKQELVYYGGKLLHKGWFGNWQLWYAKAELARLRIREAVKMEEKHEAENEIRADGRMGQPARPDQERAGSQGHPQGDGRTMGVKNENRTGDYG